MPNPSSRSLNRLRGGFYLVVTFSVFFLLGLWLRSRIVFGYIP